MSEEFEVTVDGVTLGGAVSGEGPRVLLLHGGPGLGYDYLEPLVEELAESCTVAVHQQRGLPPSQGEGPYDVADHVADVGRVLDGLGWDRAAVLGHSWGGHLALHVALALPDRLTGVLIVDPLGGVGDGGGAEFWATLMERTPAEDLQRLAELSPGLEAGEATDDQVQEHMRLIWPAYFSSRAAAPPLPHVRYAPVSGSQTMASATALLPALEASLPDIRVPTGFLAGGSSPMPRSTSTDTAELIPGAWVDVLEGVGHFVWLEQPGAVRAALQRLLAA